MAIELSPPLPESERPTDYAGLASEQADLFKVINDLIMRLEANKYRWELYEFGLTDGAERRRVRAMIDLLNEAVHAGGPAVIKPLRRAVFTADSDE